MRNRWMVRLMAAGAVLALFGCGLATPTPVAGPLQSVTSQRHASGSPEGPFLWGVSTAGFQWEGGETTSQWAAWDAAGKSEERRGLAADGYRRYTEDLDLTKGLGCNAFRTSIEWSRIEPEEGRFDPEALRHYREMLVAMRARGLTPVVTLMHFVYPAWLDKYGGWQSPQAVTYFNRFVERVVKEYGDLTDWYLTFNEPTVFIAGGYLSGNLPPGKVNDLKGAALVTKNLVAAHVKAYRTIHANDPVAHVSFNNYSASWTLTAGPQDDQDDFLRQVLGTDEGLPKLDYIAIDYYTRLKVRLPFQLPGCWDWPVYPEGFYNALKHYHQWTGLPVLVAENGMATEDLKERQDGWTREAYLTAHVEQLQRAIKDGVPVLGYIHWSITDNYEWGSYRPRFGLYSVECRTGDLRRVPTPAADTYRRIIAAGGVTPAIAGTVRYPSSYRPIVRP
ncbi:MAG TPA: family 1 glycosylhydrolase [Stenomitos sp.]